MGAGKAKANYRRMVLRLPDLDHSKSAVLDNLPSPGSRRIDQYAIEQFTAWCCPEPRLAYEAADAGLLSPELVAGIGSVNGVKQLGFRWKLAESGP
jgi:hypothetical protein